MGWERRGNGLYYYRAKKVGGRVLKEYCGAGLMGGLAALADEDDRVAKEKCDVAGRALCVAFDQVEGNVKEISALVDAVTTDLLQAAGYHRHHRGHWRHCRGRR